MTQTAEKKRQQQNAAQARRRARRRDAGLCQTCGKGPGPSCDYCLDRHRKRTAVRVVERKAAGLCYRCAAPLNLAVNSTSIKYPQCTTCFMKATADHHLGGRHRWAELLQIFEKQEGCCAYTGELLILGDNASLDHKIPRSRGGADEVDNLQWVTWTINDCKRNLTHDEFVALCRRVAGC